LTKFLQKIFELHDLSFFWLFELISWRLFQKRIVQRTLCNIDIICTRWWETCAYTMVPIVSWTANTIFIIMQWVYVMWLTYILLWGAFSAGKTTTCYGSMEVATFVVQRTLCNIDIICTRWWETCAYTMVPIASGQGDRMVTIVDFWPQTYHHLWCNS
jgi:hypothetical protein